MINKGGDNYDYDFESEEVQKIEKIDNKMDGITE